ncbi:DUF3526 domain-containing protein [Fulvivirga sediminis]|uniref:DUF3526 domain-containing protein n=1 Tax=Fulvivirga sediminis TaxID=2803949 RepID=A0A937K2X0_9BACT|nr:DUF3526 domain-containing protein [Fulvivirga sediminis]MBL3658810.1 DUF3526 domain-containing protein [Fulvivirga sediminis]
MSLYLLMFRQFVRTRICQLGLSMVLVLGIISIFIGKQFLDKQRATAAQVAETQQEHIKRNVDLHKDDLGLLLYYLKFAVVNDVSPLAGLSIGQKDINPSVQNVTILALEGQKYDADLVNPATLLFGNLDLSFLIVYVFPLLVIAFNYNLLSEEEEGGTWKMVSVMSVHRWRHLFTKMSVRAVLLFGVLIILFIIAAGILGIEYNLAFSKIILTSMLYIAFWFAIVAFIISLRRSSNFNAVALLFCWLIFLILIPAVLNNVIVNKYPMPEAFTTMIKQRDGYHEKWDTNKRETVEKFYKQYPQFSSYGFPSEASKLQWLWYYAMQNLGDVESKEESALLEAKVLKRDDVSQTWSMLVPSLHAQLIFNSLAGTGMENYLDFLNYTEQFHEKTRLYLYPKIFSYNKAEGVDWDRFKPEHVSFEAHITWSHLLLPFIGAIFLLVCATLISFRYFNS